MTANLKRTNKVSIRFQAAHDEVVLAQLAGPGNVEFNDVAQYRVADLEAFQESLSRKLEAYQTKRRPATLEALVREGYQAYRAFVRGFNDDIAKDWWIRIVKDRGSVTSPILELTILDRLTIPFGLFFVENPDHIKDWKRYEEIVEGFIGVHFALHKLYRRQKRLAKSITQLCREQETPRILHSMDRRLRNAVVEQRNWAQLNGQVTTPNNSRDVVANWTNEDAPPHLVHCSCHLSRDPEGYRFVSCGDNDRIYVRDLDDATLEYPPFVFLNSCGSGAISSSHRDNFVWQLFPRVASGFVATTCEVSDPLAAKISEHFYRNFAGGAPVITALQQAIQSEVRGNRDLGALAYVLWESDPYLTLRA